MRREAGGKAAERLFGIRPCRGAGRESGWDLNRAQGDCSGRFRSLEVVFFGLIPLSGVCSLGFGGSMVAFAQVRLGCCVFFFFFLALVTLWFEWADFMVMGELFMFFSVWHS